MTTLSQLEIGSARRIDIDLPDRRVAALQTGRTGSPAVLLVPGYTGSKEDFGPILDPLADAGFCVTAIDLPGQYESPGFADPADYSTRRLGASLRGVAGRLGTRVRLLGHSFGGLVARSAVIDEPGLFDSLVLLSSGPAQLGGLRRTRIEDLQPVLSAAGLPGVYAAMQAAAGAEPGYVAPVPDVAEFLERRFLGGSPEMLQGMGDALRNEPDRVDELRATGVPILVAHGVDDDAWPPEVQQEMAGRLGARYVAMPDAAHSPAVENPDAIVAALLDFWRD